MLLRWGTSRKKHGNTFWLSSKIPSLTSLWGELGDLKIDHEIIPYFEKKSNFEGKEDLEEECSPRDEYDVEDIKIRYYFYDTPTYFKKTISLRLEYTLSYYETKYIKDVESLRYYLQHLDVENFTDNQILKHLE